MTDPTAAGMVRRWLELVDVDLHVAQQTLRERYPGSAWAVCFHAQQAAER